MIVYPAIDLRGGRVVRLKYGDPAQQTVYGDDPVAVAHGWRAAGAAWLHVVNLDGALGAAGAEATLKVVSALAVATGMRIQFGGGVRDAGLGGAGVRCRRGARGVGDGGGAPAGVRGGDGRVLGRGPRGGGARCA
ncbi:MAG: HisA/HisF-related TIM barrel protein [Anaerolineae bacterium]|nr:HisA/HisF-related TIM barrel protein [Anaerolineae bacterium]